MKLTKNQLKELVKEAIIETVSEEDKVKVVQKKEKEGPKKASTDIQDNPFDDEEKEKEKTDESISRRFTVKEVQKWMKTLEENRYKKVYNADARRVAWMVNNEGVELSEMPKSMSKKWTKAQYGRERYLAKEFIKSKSEQLSEGLDLKKLETAIKDFQNKIKKQGRVTNARDEDHLKQLIKVYKQMGGKKIKEQKLREQIREIIKEQLNEKSFGDTRKIKFDKKDGSKVANLITSRKWKFTTPLYKSKGLKDIELHVPKKEYNKTIEFFMKNKLNPRG